MKKMIMLSMILTLASGCALTRLSIPVGDKYATYTDLRNPLFERGAKVEIATNGTLKVAVEQKTPSPRPSSKPSPRPPRRPP